MPGPLHPAVSVGFLSATAGLCVAGIAWRQRDPHGARVYAILMVVLSVWSSSYALQLLHPTVSEKGPLFLLRHSISPAIGVLFWVFTARYTDRRELLSTRYLAPIVVIGAGMTLLPVLNPADLYWTDIRLYEDGFVRAQPTFGPLFWVLMAYVSVVVAGAHTYIVRELMDSFAVYRRQLGALAVVGGGEFVALFLFLSDHVDLVPSINPVPYLQVVSYSTVFLGILFGWSYFRASLFELQPLTRRTVVEHMDDAVLVFDKNDRLRNSNVRARRLVGLDPAGSETEGTPAEMVFANRPELFDIYQAHDEGSPADTPDDGQTGSPELPDPITDGAVESTHVELSDGDGSRHYDIRISTIRNSIGHRTGTVVVARDVTVRRRQREMLETQKRELERQNERLDEFVGAVSHDLRNPLYVAKGRVELARTESDSKHLAVADDMHDRMGALIDDLLTLSRAGQAVENPEPTALASVVEDAWGYADVANCELVASIPPGKTVAADPDRLLQLFENLYRNAADHNDPPLTVRVGPIDNNSNQRIGFFVEDDGSGIPEEARGEIFDRGYTTAPDGTGFGLYIVRDIVEAHGWEIHVTDGTDGGARFEITGVETSR